MVKLDRLGWNTRDVLNLVHELEEKELASGCMVLTGLGMVAEMELGFVRDVQRAGIEAPKSKGIKRAARPLSTVPASSPCLKEGWERQKSPSRGLQTRERVQDAHGCRVERR